MTSRMRTSIRPRPLARLSAWATVFFVFGCAHIPFDPAPVVPTKNRLPYSARVSLSDIGAYLVSAGATMLPDPNVQNRVTGQVASLTADRARWEKAVADYVSARRTFRSVQTDGEAEVSLSIRLLIYIDPGVGFKFDTVYVARAEARLAESESGHLVGEYSGFGKAPGVVRRSGPGDDEAPVNRAVHTALNDLFGTLEADTRLASLRVPLPAR